MKRWHMIHRKEDEAILLMLQLRDDGMSLKQIAHFLGTTKGVVSGSLFRVDRDYAISEMSVSEDAA